MTGQLIWWSCILLELVLLLRSIPLLVRRFPIFYAYIACVLLKDLMAIPIYKNLPAFYATFYWSTVFLTAVLGYGVILEIYGRILEKFLGVARFMRIVLVGVLLAVIGRALLQLFGNSPSLLASSAALLEQDLRILQAVFLAALLGIFTFYRIPIGKNLRGIIAGYALYIGVRIIELTVYTRFRKPEGIFVSKLEPVSYLICLGIWTTALWSRSAEPNVEMASNIERDYEQLAGLTKSKLIRARAYLTRTVRS